MRGEQRGGSHIPDPEFHWFTLSDHPHVPEVVMRCIGEELLFAPRKTLARLSQVGMA